MMIRFDDDSYDNKKASIEFEDGGEGNVIIHAFLDDKEVFMTVLWNREVASLHAMLGYLKDPRTKE